MATENITEFTKRRTPPAAWLSYKELKGVPPDNYALSGALGSYLDAMDANLDVLSDGGLEDNVVEQLTLGAYHKTLEMREFFESWRAALPNTGRETHDEAHDRGPERDELRQKAKEAFFRSQPTPQAIVLTKAFEGILDGDLDEATIALQLFARLADKAIIDTPLDEASDSFDAADTADALRAAAKCLMTVTEFAHDVEDGDESRLTHRVYSRPIILPAS